MFYFLLLLSLSYWYCLPVASQSVVRYSEFRVYDFLLLILIAVMVSRYWGRLRLFFRRNASGKWLLRFCVWCSATFPVTVIWSITINKAHWALVSLIFLFHLWGFVIAYAAFCMFIQTRRRCLVMLDVFLLVGGAVATIICLQGLGLVPRFWSSLYDVYGARSFSATLGPNRTTPGHTMILVVAIAAGYWRNLGAVGARQLCLASISATTAILALGLTGSRTAWVTFIAFGALLLLGQRPKLSLVVFVVIAAASVIVVAPGSLRESIEDTYEWRVDSKLSGEPEADAITKFRAVDAGRLDKWIGGLETLAERPWLIPFGGGFNNYRYSVEAGISAHNMYITLVGEVGIVGLFFYLKWLLSVRRRSLRLTGLGVKLGERGRKVFLPVEMNNLLIAMMVSLLAGEVLFPYRPAFSFMGMFLFLCSVMNNSALVWGERTQPVSAAAAGRLQVGTGMFRPAPRRTPGLVVWPSHRLDKGAVQ